MAGPSRSLLSVLGTPAVVVDVLLLVDKLPSAVVFLMHATSYLCSARVWPPAGVKTQLGVADADHGDTYHLWKKGLQSRFVNPINPGCSNRD
jgi:hypothetical protein